MIEALSPREVEVLILIAEGSTRREAAKKLGVTTETVNTLLGRVRRKLGASTTTHAAVLACAEGLLDGGCE